MLIWINGMIRVLRHTIQELNIREIQYRLNFKVYWNVVG